MKLSEVERETAADHLDQVLKQIQEGILEAKIAEVAFLHGVVRGLRA